MKCKSSIKAVTKNHMEMLHQQHNFSHAHKPRCHQPVHGTSKWTPYTQQSNLLLRYLFQIKATFSDATIYKGERFKKESVCHLRTHFKPTETFQYTFYTTCHPPWPKKGFVKGKLLWLPRANSSIEKFKENFRCLKRLVKRGYLENFIDNTLS